MICLSTTAYAFVCKDKLTGVAGCPVCEILCRRNARRRRSIGLTTTGAGSRRTSSDIHARLRGDSSAKRLSALSSPASFLPSPHRSKIPCTAELTPLYTLGLLCSTSGENSIMVRDRKSALFVRRLRGECILGLRHAGLLCTDLARTDGKTVLLCCYSKLRPPSSQRNSSRPCPVTMYKRNA